MGLPLGCVVKVRLCDLIERLRKPIGLRCRSKGWGPHSPWGHTCNVEGRYYGMVRVKVRLENVARVRIIMMGMG